MSSRAFLSGCFSLPAERAGERRSFYLSRSGGREYRGPLYEQIADQIRSLSLCMCTCTCTCTCTCVCVCVSLCVCVCVCVCPQTGFKGGTEREEGTEKGEKKETRPSGIRKGIERGEREERTRGGLRLCRSICPLFLYLFFFPSFQLSCKTFSSSGSVPPPSGCNDHL